MYKTTQLALPCLCALVLAAGSTGCKKERQASAPQKTNTGSVSSMDTPDKREPPPARRRIRVSPKVLPIPADMPALRFNVAKLRTTAWFKRSEGSIRTRLVFPSRIADAMKACKVDPINNVEGATVGASLAKGRLGDLVVVMKIDRSTAKLLACLKGELGKHKMEVKPLTLAGRKGLVTRHAGRAAALVALRDNQLLIIIGDLQKRIAAVLTGKAPSIATTTLYNEVNAQVGPDSLFGGIFPGLPDGKEEHLPKLLRSFRTGALIVSLPKGKSALRINLHFEDQEKAKSITKKLPRLLQLAGSQYPGMKDIGAKPKARPKKGWAYLDFKLEDRTFTQIMTLLEGLLLPAQTSPPAPKK
jgi:hypothetical protein